MHSSLYNDKVKSKIYAMDATLGALTKTKEIITTRERSGRKKNIS